MKPALIIVGLGNPGKQYEKTRHNLGWIALDMLRADIEAGEFTDGQKFLCTATEAELEGHSLLLVKPITFMNRSGECVRKLIDFYKLNPAKQLLVVCDDIDLPAGAHRLRMSGGPGTHNGLKSIVDSIGENFPRHRIGLGEPPKEIDLAAWILSRLSSEEVEIITPALKAVKVSAQHLLDLQ